MKNCAVTNNQSPDGSAIKAYAFLDVPTFPVNASTHFENCLMAGNTGSESAISFDLAPKFSMLSTTVAENGGGALVSCNLNPDSDN